MACAQEPLSGAGLRVCLASPSLTSHSPSFPNSWKHLGKAVRELVESLVAFRRWCRPGHRVITCQVGFFKALKKGLSPDLKTYLQFFFFFVLSPHLLSAFHFLAVFLSALQCNTFLLWKLGRGEEIVEKQSKHTLLLFSMFPLLLFL